MSMDELEDFIRNNREKFDDQETPPGAWTNIERTLGLGQQTFWNSVGLWRAAAVIFMVSTAALLVVMSQQKKSDVAPSQDATVALNDFRDVEQFYVKQISEKVQLIDKFQQSEGLNGFTQDFQQLEAMYMVLKEEMKLRPSEKVQDALVLNLLVRIDLLNQRLHKLERGEDHKKPDKQRSV